MLLRDMNRVARRRMVAWMGGLFAVILLVDVTLWPAPARLWPSVLAMDVLAALVGLAWIVATRREAA